MPAMEESRLAPLIGWSARNDMWVWAANGATSTRVMDPIAVGET